MKKSKLRPIAFVMLLIIMALILVTYFSFDKEMTKTGSMLSDSYRSDDLPPEHRKVPVTEKFAGMKVVHIDLKGAPPKVEYFRTVFPLFSQMGVQGLLMEYEDMFPYSGELKAISAYNAYTARDVRNINRIAKENNLIVIPLVQTFGHLEFVLKLQEYRDLREVLQYPQAICPSNNRSMSLIKEMIRQMLDAHPDSNTIHVGCDEVFHFGVCNKCYGTIVRHSWTKFQLFLNHVTTIARLVHQRNPDIKVLIWDDMLREIDQTQLLESGINKYVTPVVWKYKKNVYEDLGPALWEKYISVFTKVWIASAFKGAMGSAQSMADPLFYLENHKSWMQIVSDYKHNLDFEGILITGWQRYDHFSVLCELLPVALPSLAMCMRFLSGHREPSIGQPTHITTLLGCKRPYSLIGSTFDTPKCSYSGSEILEGVLNLKRLREEFAYIMEDSRVQGWMSDFNVRYAFSSPEYVEGATRQIGRMKIELDQIQAAMVNAMLDVYDNYTINEWVDTYVLPFKKEIVALWEKKEVLSSQDVWPRRPININATKVT